MKQLYSYFSIRPIFFCIGFLFSVSSFGQNIAPPPGINYQAIARDTSGLPLSNCTNLSVKFTIYDSIQAGNVIFTEIHPYVSTNRYGLFTLVIGDTNTVGFDAIPWAAGNKFLEVGIDSGGTGFFYMPRTQLISVPYALHSKTALYSYANWALTGNQPNSAHFIGATNNAPLLFRTNNIQRMILDSIGRLGIGTGSPTAPLTIQTLSAIGNELEFPPAGFAATDILAHSQFNIGSTASLNLLTSGLNRLTIVSSGNVGIGTTAPTALLELAGQIKITGGSPGLNKVLTSDASGLATWAAPIFSNVGNGLNINGDTINSVWTQSGNNIFNNNSGNVGVGTINPTIKLEVVTGDLIPHDGISSTHYSNQDFSDAHIWLKRARGTESGPSALQVGDQIGFIKFRGYDSNNGFSEAFDQTEIGAIAAENFSSSANGSHLVFMTTPNTTLNGVERMRITQAGRVGIGTNSPSTKLDVQGTVTISGSNTNELNRSQTGAANLVPIAFGNIPFYPNNSGPNISTGNFSVTWDGTGYVVDINNENYVAANYVTLVTPINSNAKPYTIDDGNGNLKIVFYNQFNAPIQTDFQFIVYKP